LSNLVDPFCKKRGGIGFFGWIGFSVLDDIPELVDKKCFAVIFLSKTGIIALVTNRSYRIDPDQKRIVVTIKFDGFEHQKVAGGFTLGPKPLFGPAEKSDFLGRNGQVQRFLVHITKHQDSTCDLILNDGRHQTIYFVKIYI